MLNNIMTTKSIEFSEISNISLSSLVLGRDKLHSMIAHCKTTTQVPFILRYGKLLSNSILSRDINLDDSAVSIDSSIDIVLDLLELASKFNYGVEEVIKYFDSSIEL